MAANKDQPSFHILICLIQIWELKDAKKPLEEPTSPLLITEVEDIEISDSYRKLIGSASVRFPSGTVIKKTLTELNSIEYNSKISADTSDHGILITTRTDSRKASVDHFKVGQRITIMLGYTTDPRIAALSKVDENGKSIHNDFAKLAEYKKNLTTMFDGYISKCSIDLPIEIECENLASGLKKITCPKVIASKNLTVNDFLSDKGEYRLLGDSGLSLHPETEAVEINIGKVNLDENLTVADVLTEWGKYKIFAFVKDHNGKPCIAVGRSYFSNAGKDSILKLKSESSIEPEILFDYHVASNELTLLSSDKMFLAVEATSLGSDDKFFRMTIRKNPEYDSSVSGSKEWQVLNETKMSKKKMKLMSGKIGQVSSKVDLSKYTVIPYMSKKIGISKEGLLEEAIKYFESYNMNGIEGTLTIFGDCHLKSGSAVRLVDKRYSQKNGRYLVDEVTTKFGTNGYRQTIKLPYCISRDKQTNKEESNGTK